MSMHVMHVEPYSEPDEELDTGNDCKQAYPLLELVIERHHYMPCLIQYRGNGVHKYLKSPLLYQFQQHTCRQLKHSAKFSQNRCAQLCWSGVC